MNKIAKKQPFNAANSMLKKKMFIDLTAKTNGLSIPQVKEMQNTQYKKSHDHAVD
ncbi:hypothetical protein JZO70_14705 [Enterococcus sp. 669A]|uniref:Uncharacterized protein n=1 Tax=Candidatus Enterococcus moelleringii TaxID=2815325 RepID=A0ABS3LEB2_9ENTE|nr:hypothetical protein [Enterococcus sp. 669A]MBO1307425.1 hypothetical protein [Enterococcus sp. 669A]